MAALAQSTRRKLSLLHLAQELQSVSKAGRIMGYHRDTFYEVEAAILAYALEHPPHGAQRVANELRLQNVNVGVSVVRGVWSRHDLEARLKRLLRLERHVQETAFVVSAEQLRLLERHSVEFRCRHVEATKPGELLNQGTFFWGTLKGGGKVYVQVVVDVF